MDQATPKKNPQNQYILEVQVAQELGVLVGQLGDQGLDLILNLGVFFQAAFEEPISQGVKYECFS